jgi:spermidine/putrescine transport system permease protein
MEKARPAPPSWARGIFLMTALFLLLPLLIMVFGSFVDQGQVTVRWYQEILADDDLLSALWRSLSLGIQVSFFSTALGAMAAVGLYKSDFPMKKILNSFSVLSLVLPELVFALSLLSWFFLLQVQLSTTTVLMAHISFSLSFAIFLISSRLSQLDESLDDAARDLGAGEWRILWTITTPLLMPAMLGSFVLCFLLSFDDFLISYFVSGVGSDTLPIRLYTSIKTGHSPKLNALSTLMTIISLSAALFLVSSKNIRSMLSNKQ